MNKIIRQALAPLIGLPLRHIVRSGNMLVAHFGHGLDAPEGSARHSYEWTLRVQCPWRISQGKHILIAYRDFFYSDAPLKNLAVMTRSNSSNVLESLCAEFELRPPSVASLDSDDTGGFSLRLSSDYRLDVIPAEGTESGKYWRIAEAGAEGRSFVYPPSQE